MEKPTEQRPDERGADSCAAPGSAKYIPVKCKACGWEDGLREDLVAAGKLEMFCDSCSDVRPVELISPNKKGQR